MASIDPLFVSLADLAAGEIPIINFTISEMRRCAARELLMRRKVYPKWVKSGRMTENQAAREIVLMGMIVRHFEALEQQVLPFLKEENQS